MKNFMPYLSASDITNYDPEIFQLLDESEKTHHVCLQAIRQHAKNLEFIPKVFFQEKRFALEAFVHPRFFSLVPTNFWQDYDCMAKVIRGNWGLYYVPTSFRNDKKMVLLALESSSRIFLHYQDWFYSKADMNPLLISTRLMDDKDVVLRMLQKNLFRSTQHFQRVSDRLRSHFDIAKGAVEQNLYNFHAIDNQFTNDRAFMIGFPVCYCSMELRDDRDFILQKLDCARNEFHGENVPYMVNFLSNRLRSDKLIMRRLIELNEANMLLLPLTLHADKEFLKEILRYNVHAFSYCLPRFAKSLDFILELLQEKIFVLPMSFREDLSSILQILPLFPEFFKKITPSLRDNPKVIDCMLQLDTNHVSYFLTHLLYSKPFYVQHLQRLTEIFKKDPSPFRFQSALMQLFRDRAQFIIFLQTTSSAKVHPVFHCFDLCRTISSFLF